MKERVSPFGTAGVGRDDGAISPLGYVLLDPLEDSGLGEQVVHGNVEEALDLAGVKVHRDDVIGSGDRQHVSYQLGRDGRSTLKNCKFHG